MKLSYLLAEAMQNGQADEVLTAVGEALSEVMERNRCSCNNTSEQAFIKNKPFNKAAELVFRARNLFRNP